MCAEKTAKMLPLGLPGGKKEVFGSCSNISLNILVPNTWRGEPEETAMVVTSNIVIKFQELRKERKSKYLAEILSGCRGLK